MARRFTAVAGSYLTWGPTEAAFNMTGAVTFSFWMRPQTTTDEAIWTRWRNNVDRQWYFDMGTAGVAVVRFDLLTNPGGAGIGASGPIPVKVGKWSHVVGVFEPSVRVSCWVDGFEGRTTTSQSSIVGSAAVHVQMGKLYDDHHPPYKGDIRDAAVWHAALNSTEVLALKDGKSPLEIRPDSLKGYWTFRDEKLRDVKYQVPTVATAGTEGAPVPIVMDDGIFPVISPALMVALEYHYVLYRMRVAR